MLKKGGKPVEIGVIDSTRDLFYLQINKPESLVKGELNNCKGIILERKATMEHESKRTRLPRV